MKRYSLLKFTFVLAFLLVTFGCEKTPEPGATVCRLTSTNDQIVEANGKLTAAMERNFTYVGAAVTSLFERSDNQIIGFQTEYENNRLARAKSGQALISLEFGASNALANRATYTSDGKVQSTFVMDYTPSGRLSKVVETRQVLPTNSQVKERTYTFNYDANGNLLIERARLVLVNGIAIEQETEYTFEDKPSPYTHFPELSLLTVMALVKNVESLPGRFWHLKVPSSYKTYAISNGTRGSLREDVTFSMVYDQNNKLTTQEQNTKLYQVSVPTPITRKNQQAFVYQCE